ncbi:acetyl-CoA acetyltransferase [Sinobacterium caligoides]|uniref:Acetyl-CoA acetyltransferase n=1 Tax=Sinobacterium caligoides TaxID=933926 RepID=A0A3N2DNS4_9GAMM|nr:lipid-transfer protein [Sinobacterium caligoides]ROS01447.1 acetyl-CoA acetyltransferase [Sinobacterium caligoides]
MAITLHNEAAIVGIGQTAFSKNSGVSELALAAEAVKNCLDDAGLDPVEVDGLSTFTLDSTDEVELARAVGLGDLHMFAKINYGGGAAVGLIQQAAMAVATGVCKYVVVWRAMNGRSGQRMGQGVSGEIISSDLIHWSWYMSHGMLTPASWVALIASNYMAEYGAGSEHLAEIAIAQRNYALNNPVAAGFGKPLTMDDYMNAKMISEPLRLYDCCQETDGGVALLITTPERARDLRQKPAIVRAVTQASTRGQEQMTSFYRDDLNSLPEMELAARRVYEMSGLSADDIDASCLYDAFTPEVLMQLESFGFCGRGEAKDFVQEGALRIDGRLPNNTHGGLLSEAYIHGVNNIAEGVRLIRGTSTSQPPKPINHALVSSGVGVPTGALILGADD